MTVDEIIREAEALSDEDLQMLASRIRNGSLKRHDAEIRKKTESHAGYVGKCYVKKVKPMSGAFPEMRKYYRVVSERADNEYRMTALTFTEKPLCSFRPRFSKTGLPGDGYSGSFRFDGIQAEDVPFFCFSFNGGLEIDSMTEISEEEYFKALDAYVNEIKTMKWEP